MRKVFLHLFHCGFLILGVCSIITYLYTGVTIISDDDDSSTGFWTCVAHFILSFNIILTVPYCILQFMGMLWFNIVPSRVDLKYDIKSAPFVCFRVVTKGDYPALVKHMLKVNHKICQVVGLENFMFEIVTEKHLELDQEHWLKETVVPSDYVTKKGSLFKARNLQYCLDINRLPADAWIVHLDEDTQITENSVRGVINFICVGKHTIGTGVMTQGKPDVQHWLNTLAESRKTAHDLGVMKFQSGVFHTSMYCMRGVFFVVKVEAELDITFENGPEGSIVEDAYFGYNAMQKGYTFDYIQGEMLEQSAITTIDFIRQRARVCHGGWMLFLCSKEIYLKAKFFIATGIIPMLMVPIAAPLFILLPFIKPLPLSLQSILFCNSFVMQYSSIIAFMYTFSISRLGIRKYIFLFLLQSSIIAVYEFVVGYISVWISITLRKPQFHVAIKE